MTISTPVFRTFLDRSSRFRVIFGTYILYYPRGFNLTYNGFVEGVLRIV